MGQLSDLWTKSLKRNYVWKTNFRPLSAPECQGDYLTVLAKLRRCSGVTKLQPMWYLAKGREDSTPEVLEP